MGGCDAVAFTGGVGENSATVRSLATAGLGFLGLQLDEARNRTIMWDDDGVIALHSPRGTTRVFAVRAQEEAVMAAETFLLLAPDPARTP